MTTKLEKALAIVEAGKIDNFVFEKGEIWSVSATVGEYTVSIDENRKFACSCLDNSTRKSFCKHCLAVLIKCLNGKFITQEQFDWIERGRMRCLACGVEFQPTFPFGEYCSKYCAEGK